MCRIESDVANARLARSIEWDQTRGQAIDFARLMLGDRITQWHQFRWPWESDWIWALAPKRLWPSNMLLFNPDGANGPALAAVQVHNNEDGKQSLRILHRWLWSDLF